MSEFKEVTEPLEKKCPRCGKSSANSSNPSGRCSACLKKLASNKKKPGHWQRAQTKADDALRRQKGKNGTAHKKTSGLGSRKSIVKQTQSAEKKTGEKLSPDRKNNGKGYAASNTRMVPEKLNRGRHHVDEKKLRNWKKKLKKSELDTASLYTLLKAKTQLNEELFELIKALGPDGIAQYIDLFDVAEPMAKSKFIKPKGFTAPKNPTFEPLTEKGHSTLGDKGNPGFYDYKQDMVAVDPNPSSGGTFKDTMHHEHQHRLLGHLAKQLDIKDHTGKGIDDHQAKTDAVANHLWDNAGISDDEHGAVKGMLYRMGRHHAIGDGNESIANVISFMNGGPEFRKQLSDSKFPTFHHKLSVDEMDPHIRSVFKKLQGAASKLKPGDQITTPPPKDEDEF